MILVKKLSKSQTRIELSQGVEELVLRLVLLNFCVWLNKILRVGDALMGVLSSVHSGVCYELANELVL